MSESLCDSAPKCDYSQISNIHLSLMKIPSDIEWNQDYISKNGTSVPMRQRKTVTIIINRSKNAGLWNFP